MDKKAFKAIEKGNIADLKKVINSTTINLPDKKGETLLHHAARAGHLDICKLLVQTGCDPKLRSVKGQTAADVVDIKKKKGVATWLKEQEINVSSWLTSLSSSANIYFYENENWKSIVSGGILEILLNTPLFAFKLLAKDSSHSVQLDSLLDKDLLYSKATDTFHNFRSTSGDIWGFEFTGGVSSADQFFIAIEEIKEKLKNPPAQNNISSGNLLSTHQPTPPQPPSNNINNNINNNNNLNNNNNNVPQAPPAPVGGGPPPPPPPPSAPPSEKGGLSLAEQIAEKKEKGLTAKSEVESDQHSDQHSDHHNNDDKPSSGGGGGGNMMSELANRLKRRQTIDNNVNKHLEVAKEVTEENNIEKTTTPPANKPIKQTPINNAQPPSAPLKKSVAHPPPSSSSSVASAGGIKKEELAELKAAMIESFRSELQDIKLSLITSLRAEIQQAYSK